MADAFGGSNMTADDCCKQIVNWEERLSRNHRVNYDRVESSEERQAVKAAAHDRMGPV